MSTDIALIVLLAALLHASWNALLKGSADRAVTLGLISVGHVIPGLFIVAVVPLPGLDAVPFIIASTVIHWGYYLLLNHAYKLGDLSVIYPVARGLAPVLIAMGAQIWVGEILSPGAWAGILLVSGGIMTLAVRRGATLGAGLGAALATAVVVACYSVVDGVGVRTAETALSYIGWLFVVELLVPAFVLVRFPERVRATPPRVLVIGILGGIVSCAAYGLVLYAKTLAPLGLVSALRETSVIFAAILGIVLFREGPASRRLIAAGIVAAGIATLALAGSG